jgi:hypothetical protein
MNVKQAKNFNVNNLDQTVEELVDAKLNSNFVFR